MVKLTRAITAKRLVFWCCAMKNGRHNEILGLCYFKSSVRHVKLTTSKVIRTFRYLYSGRKAFAKACIGKSVNTCIGRNIPSKCNGVIV